MITLIGGVGCGKSGVPVSGTVTYNGKPLDSGSISFIPANGIGPTLSVELKNGKYSLGADRGMQPGDKSVRIDGFVKTGKQIAASAPSPPGTMVDEIVVMSTVGESAKVTAEGTNEFNFVLDPKKSARNR